MFARVRLARMKAQESRTPKGKRLTSSGPGTPVRELRRQQGWPQTKVAARSQLLESPNKREEMVALVDSKLVKHSTRSASERDRAASR